MDFNSIPDFKSFITEKSGVIERETYSEYDEYDISRIINDFMYHIQRNPNEDFEVVELMFDKPIKIIYKPTDNPSSNGVTEKRVIYIYKHVNKQNYMDVKYTLVHELVHMVHQILSKNERPYEDLDIVGKLRYLLVRVSSENMSNYKNAKHLTLLLYLIDRNEVLSRNQNAYINAFKQKIKYPELSNQTIVNNVLDDVKMSSDFFTLAIKDLKNDKDIFNCIVGFLVGNFNELGKSGFQQYFDKSIFQIPVVKTMRSEIKQLIDNTYDFDKLCYQTIEIVKKHKNELDEHRDEIIQSFVKHMKYWFNQAQKRIGKAIQLGIDDVMDYKKF